MNDILADYREWRTQQAMRVSTHSDGCHMWHKDCMIHRLADALALEQAKRATSEAEIDALEYVVEEGRIASREDYGIIRSWLCRLRPAWESTPAEPSTPGEGTRQAECPYVTGTVTRYCTLTPFTLTDAERPDGGDLTNDDAIVAATLRGLLERTK